MTRTTVHDLLQIPHAVPRGLDALLDSAVTAISTDTRTLTAGDVFIALHGATFDGHAFIDRAFERGALLCIVSAKWHRSTGGRFSSHPLLIVRDTLAAYGEIARLYRSRFSIPVLAITGSNGKTTTREACAAVLGTTHRVLQTAGNFNNQIGLPATLLRLDATHDVAVVEFGTNQPGDISALCAIAQPSHALITNIGRAHIEKLRSREGIAEEKGALYRSLPKTGVAIVNADEPLVKPALRRGMRKVTFGFRPGADIRITDVTLDPLGRPTVRFTAPKYTARAIRLSLRMHGYHAATTAAAALAVGFAFGCPLSKMRAALEALDNVDRRMRVFEADGVRVIDDSYNANPDSVIAALDTLARMQTDGRRIAVLGDMLELGGASRREHRAIGDRFAGLDVSYVLTFGSHAREIARGAAPAVVFAEHFTDIAALRLAVDALVEPGDLVLVKGSRGMHMDDITAFLRGRTTERPEAR